jgi:hypothetical protein
MDIKSMLDEIKARKKLTKNKIVVGKLDEKVVEFLNKRGVPIHTKEIYLTHKGLSHLARESKKQRGAGLSEEDILRISDVLENPYAIYFDSKKDKLNLLYCGDKKECSKLIKIIVDTNSIANRKERITLVKTAGYVQEYNVRNNKDYIVLKEK